MPAANWMRSTVSTARPLTSTCGTAMTYSASTPSTGTDGCERLGVGIRRWRGQLESALDPPAAAGEPSGHRAAAPPGPSEARRYSRRMLEVGAESHLDLREVASARALGLGDEAAAAAAASSRHPGLARIEAEAARLAAHDLAVDDVLGAVSLVEERVEVDVNAPLGGGSRAATAAKRVVRKLTRFAFAHLADQTTELGHSLIRVGRAAAQRLEAVESRVDSIDDRIGALERLLEASERGRPAR